MPRTAAPQDKGLTWGSKPLSILSALLLGAEDTTELAALPTALSPFKRLLRGAGNSNEVTAAEVELKLSSYGSSLYLLPRLHAIRC